MFIAGGLIALGVGYLVYTGAGKEKEGVKLLGQAIGIFVMIAAALSIVCGAMRCAYLKAAGGCPTMASRGGCPMTQGQGTNS
ncbi:MAG: hypothetical protein HYZ52_01470 [Candidatus Omnitrophica bacterium]|nr:hypothetical protein [Candidatus Omnitrophota bacterium]